MEAYRFSAPFAFESSQTFIAFRHFAEIKDLKSIPARVIDSLPEDNVIGPKSKIARLGGSERVCRSSTEGEEDAAARFLTPPLYVARPAIAASVL